MDSRLVAKITVPRVDDQTRTGTAYPVGVNLLLTARHVIEFTERDRNKPITVKWQDVSATIVIEPQNIALAFDGKEQLDVILIRCTIPQAIAVLVTSAIFESEKIHSREGWEALGFPKVNNFERKGATGTFGVDSKQPTIDLTLDDTINEEILKANKIENGWGGMSGAPVFSCTKPPKLQAIITDHNQWMQKQLIGVCVPYLMKLPEFRQALGLNDADEKHKKYLLDLPIRIKKQLQQIENSSLYQELANKFILDGIECSVENLWQAIEKIIISNDPISLLEKYSDSVAVVLKRDLTHINEAQTLFFLFLGFFSSPKDFVLAQHQVQKLPVSTRLAVEMNLAAWYGLAPDLVYESKEGIEPFQRTRGRYAIDGDTLLREMGPSATENAKELVNIVNTVISKVHYEVFGQNPVNLLDEKEKLGLDFLNETIKYDREVESPKLTRLEVSVQKSSEQSNPLLNDDVLEQLLNYLPDLPLVHYGSAIEKMETRLGVIVNKFLSIIKQYSQNT